MANPPAPDFCETTSRVAALTVPEEAISRRIKSKSQEMRALHQQFRKSISPPRGVPAAAEEPETA